MKFLSVRLTCAVISLLSISIVLDGCFFLSSNTKDVDPKDPTLSILFGYIDMEGAPTSVEWVTIKQYKPKPALKYYCGVHDGMFLHIGIPPGSHQVEEFGGSRLFGGDHSYGFYNGGTNPTQIRIKKPGIYYLGSYRYTKIRDADFFSDMGGRFDLTKLNSPTEEELLRKILKVLIGGGSEKYDRQINMVRNRLKELNKEGDAR